MKRNTTISLVKAIGIIAMVVGHTECPGLLTNFIFEWHMPLFFIAAGYFFSLKYIDDSWNFVVRRFKGLYVPFVKWAVVFLLLHNVFFEIGLLNEQYGNSAGGVLHPYNWHQIAQNLWNIVTYMGGYDEFICGAYWFFRALLVASIMYLVMMKLLRHVSRNRLSYKWIAVIITAIPLLLAIWKSVDSLKIYSLAQGGYRDIMGTFFFGIGYLFKSYEYKYKQLIQRNWICLSLSTLMFIAVVVLFAHYSTSLMFYSATLKQCLSLPLPAICGWMMVYNICSVLDRCEGRVKRFLCYCGDNTLYVVLFHVLSFKLVNVAKIMYYGLDWKQMGCHMVIHDYSKDDYFWVLYSIVGLLVPLALYRLKSCFGKGGKQ